MKSVNLGLKVIKRLFAVFLVLGALMSVEAWGADKSESLQESPTTTMRTKQDFVEKAYGMLTNFAFDLTKELISKSYKAISSIFNNIVSILLATIAFFWLFNHLKNGTISKEEVFKALIWIIVFVIVYVLLNSKNAFHEFIQIFYIPQHLIASALALSDGNNVAQQINEAFVKPFMILTEIPGMVIDFYMSEKSWYEIFDTLGAMLLGAFTGGLTALIFAIYIICNLIVVVAVIIIHMYSIFLSGIYTAFLPIMIPLLLIPQTKSIFFAWVKSFIGITMYVPLSMIGIQIINQCANKIIKESAYNTINIVSNIGIYTLLGICSCVIAILLIYKIPTWISELLGVANQGVGAGGALGMMKTAGMGLGAYGKGVASNILNSKSGSTAAWRTLGNIATGGLGGVLSQSKTAAKGIAKDGFTSIGKYLNNKLNPKKNSKDEI